MFFVNISSVLITWEYPNGDDPLPILFLVQFSRDNSSYKDASGQLKGGSFVFGDMRFFAYYQFQVLAFFEGVASKPAETDYFLNGVTGKGSLSVNPQLNTP